MGRDTVETLSTTTLRNGRLADGRMVDIAITNGIIGEVKTALPTSAIAESDHDLGGWLLLPSLVEPHAHLDKALTADLVPNPEGDLEGAIHHWIEAASKGLITYEGMLERAVAALELLLVRGVTAVRSHINVMAGTGTDALRAVKEAGAGFDGLIDLQVVGLCGRPLAGPDGAGTRAALAAALEVGLDAVGGCPHLEPDALGVIDTALSAATEAGIDVDLHVDETLDASMLTLPLLARRVMETSFEGSVVASHCVSLGMQSQPVQDEVAAVVAEAGVSVIALPQTNLFLQGRDCPTATPRGITAVEALRKAGVVVAAGGDNVQDPFNLVGRSDPLETAALMIMAAHCSPESAFAMVSTNARKAIGLGSFEFMPGDPADVVAIDASSVRGAIAEAPMSRKTFRAGRLVASSKESSTVHKPAGSDTTAAPADSTRSDAVV